MQTSLKISLRRLRQTQTLQTTKNSYWIVLLSPNPFFLSPLLGYFSFYPISQAANNLFILSLYMIFPNNIHQLNFNFLNSVLLKTNSDNFPFTILSNYRPIPIRTLTKKGRFACLSLDGTLTSPHPEHFMALCFFF